MRLTQVPMSTSQIFVWKNVITNKRPLLEVILLAFFLPHLAVFAATRQIVLMHQIMLHNHRSKVGLNWALSAIWEQIFAFDHSRFVLWVCWFNFLLYIVTRFHVLGSWVRDFCNVFLSFDLKTFLNYSSLFDFRAINAIWILLSVWSFCDFAFFLDFLNCGSFLDVRFFFWSFWCFITFWMILWCCSVLFMRWWNIFLKSKRHFWDLFGTFWAIFGGHFWAIFGPFLSHFWAIFEPFLERYWDVFGPFLGHFGWFFGPFESLQLSDRDLIRTFIFGTF